MTALTDRRDGGERLAALLEERGLGPEVLVLALPRGGVPVAAPVARRLGAALDVLVVRKLGVPGHEEYAFGAVAPDGVRITNDDVMAAASLSPTAVEEVVARETRELLRRDLLYREGRAPLSVTGRAVVLIDDGLATGATMRAAVTWARTHGARRLVVAVPVGAPEICADLAALADEVVCPVQPPDLRSVGRWYREFAQVSDEEVRALLTASQEGP